MMQVELTKADIHRLLSLVRERKRKAEHGLKKFANNFDAEKGAAITASFKAYSKLEVILNEAANPRRARRDP